MKVLSPAGSLENFYSALNNGADEIYMGINAFNARAKAESINFENLKNAIIDAHILGVQVFCTLNTLIFEDEMENVVEAIKKATSLGFDAFIVQDLAVVALIKQINKNAVIHLSTQLGIHNSFGAILAEKLGASRIVLSREASIEDIKAIKRAVPNMEIEYFVQGALCVAFSGNCYLSNRLLGRSGNRGECSQLCRLPYIAKFGNETKDKAYYLSPADLCLVNHLKELKDAGVTSLKIEGRLRRASFVGVATSFYRKAVDRLNEKTQIKEICNNCDVIKGGNVSIDNNKNKVINLYDDKDLQDLKTAFNRGDYLKNAYINESQFDDIIYKNIQNHIGIKIGKVVKSEKFKDINKITLLLNKEIGKNDGLKILRNGKEITSLGVGNVEKNGNETIIYSKQKLMSNDEVRLIHSASLEEKVLSNKRTCPLELIAEFKEGQKAKLIAKIETLDLSFKVESSDVLEKAKTSAITKEDIINSLTKLNAPIFSIANISITLDNVFIAKSVLNNLRRELISEIRKHFENSDSSQFDNKQILSNAIIDLQSENTANLKENVDNELKTNYTNQNKIKTLKLVRDLKGENQNVAYFPNEFLSNETKLQINEFLTNTNENLHLFLPPFITDKDLNLIYNFISQFDKKRIVILANNIGQMYFAKEFQVIACDFCNITNSLSCAYYKKLGASGICCGYEFKDSKNVGFDFDVQIKNNNILCFLSHCPYKTITNTKCKSCAFNDKLSYIGEQGIEYKVGRYKVSRCYFYLSK
ncbi:MAG: U32 family peptidase [Clostridia bacterium]|nr:U32 family peptidase [Clostridia bacterium]